jgi:hypothetical protein
MTDTFDYIESYFAGRATETERQAFEDRCVQDEAFAEQVAFYVQTRQLFKDELLASKKAAWSAGGAPGRRKTGIVRTLYIASAAAAVLLLFSLYLLTRSASPSQAAGDYIRTHYDHLSLTLDGTRDSLTQGITAYNNRDLTHALSLFTTLAHDHPGNTDARLYGGLAYLRLGAYDQALHQFDTLANMASLYSNPGPFLKAVTLLQRNATGDRENARVILQDVVRRNLDGSQEAAAWLKKF